MPTKKLQEISNKIRADLETSILTATKRMQEAEKLQLEKDCTVAKASSLRKELDTLKGDKSKLYIRPPPLPNFAIPAIVHVHPVPRS